MSKNYEVKTNAFISSLVNTNIILNDINLFNIPAGAEAIGQRTMDNVCGIVIPVYGKAIFTVNEQSYPLESGTILHAGPSMKLNKYVEHHQPWSFYLIHYKVDGKEQMRQILHNSLFKLEVGLTKSKELLVLADELIQLSKDERLLTQLQIKVTMLKLFETLFTFSSTAELVDEQSIISEITVYIRRNLDQDLSISTLSNWCDIDQRKLHYLFQKYMGLCPKKYITAIRMRTAKEMLSHETIAISEIAHKVGYQDVYYFSRAFKKVTGFSPTMYRRRLEKSPFIMSESPF
ncbi:helix-turn-helix domain-containing protein [Fusibacter bizertensis]